MGNPQNERPADPDKGFPSSIAPEINLAIRNFIDLYQSEQQKTVLDYELEKDRIDGARSSMTSGLFRLNFTLSTNCRSSALIKIPQASLVFHIFQKLLFYEKEKYMYEQIIPRISEIWPGDGTREEDFLLDLIGAQTVLKPVARYHALSLRLLDEEGLCAGLDARTMTDYRTSWSAVINNEHFE